MITIIKHILRLMGEQRRVKLEILLRTAMPYYDSDYDGDWNMSKLIEEILEIADGKE